MSELESNKKCFVPNLKDILAIKKMDIAMLSRKTGISAKRLKSYITGEVSPRNMTIEAIAIALDVNYCDLVIDEGIGKEIALLKTGNIL